jgi:cobalt-zinc-cadmium efflux system protein
VGEHHSCHQGGFHPGHHHHGGHGAARAFRWSILLNSGLTALQLVIGFGFGSLALIGDALHNLGDVVGLALGWGAERLSRRPARGRFTYGYGRSTHLAALLNALLIFSAGVVVVVEAIQRLVDPVPLASLPVAWAAAAGIAVNLFSARLFGDDHHHDLNQRAAVLHLLTDAAVSLAVLISAVVVGATGWLWLDPLTAIGVGAAVIVSAWGLLREALALNLDAVPPGIDLARVEAVLLELPGVLAVEDLHVWGLSTSRVALTAHLRVRPDGLADDTSLAEPRGGAPLLALARERLGAIGIRNTTLQLEPLPDPSADGTAESPSDSANKWER